MDNLDMKILSRLLNNCRESDLQIGKKIGIGLAAAYVIYLASGFVLN